MRVVTVERETLEGHGAELRVGDGAHDVLDLLGEADADRVAERDLVAAELVVGARHLRHALRRHHALVRAARDARHVAAHRRVGARELRVAISELTADTCAVSTKTRAMISAYARTGIERFLHSSVTSLKRFTLSSIEQFMFFLVVRKI